jgi:hypothetical protein
MDNGRHGVVILVVLVFLNSMSTSCDRHTYRSQESQDSTPQPNAPATISIAYQNLSSAREFVSADSATKATLHRFGEIIPVTREAIIFGQGFCVLTGKFGNFSVAKEPTTLGRPETIADWSAPRK